MGHQKSGKTGATEQLSKFWSLPDSLNLAGMFNEFNLMVIKLNIKFQSLRMNRLGSLKGNHSLNLYMRSNHSSVLCICGMGLWANVLDKLTRTVCACLSLPTCRDPLSCVSLLFDDHFVLGLISTAFASSHEAVAFPRACAACFPQAYARLRQSGFCFREGFPRHTYCLVWLFWGLV